MSIGRLVYGMRGLIGYTGFVGGNLAGQREYQALYNSKNFKEMAGKHFSRLVCAGVSAVKWQANKDPEGDWRKIEALCEVLKEVNADKFILISTIDVYASHNALDEDFDNHNVENHAYGRNRLRFEDFCREHFSDCLIVRLPGLFGDGLKKNVIFDLLNDNCLEMINPESSFQYYYLKNLSGDIELAEKAGLKLINLFTEPVATKEIIEKFFPGKRVGWQPSAEGHYNLFTRNAGLWGKIGHYCYTRSEVMAQLSEFIQGYGRK